MEVDTTRETPTDVGDDEPAFDPNNSPTAQVVGGPGAAPQHPAVAKDEEGEQREPTAEERARAEEQAAAAEEAEIEHRRLEAVRAEEQAAAEAEAGQQNLGPGDPREEDAPRRRRRSTPKANATGQLDPAKADLRKNERLYLVLEVNDGVARPVHYVGARRPRDARAAALDALYGEAEAHEGVMVALPAKYWIPAPVKIEVERRLHA